ncbi:hypothetical protein [Massilia sp. YMA4]|uniref:Uncharacterized protein n=1 Tax=[Empedobacter] haloabium TaxID=592317 RepID=A0ABZ1URL3_9BURK|nr:hypothetical protein [Massilia sp. YMA4]AXA91376.1 hypothetical protein DPH57_09555 [Massilia sp. YMA4]
MLLLAALTTIAVAVTANDEFHVPATERARYEAVCYQRPITLIEQSGVLTLTAGGSSVDISATAFARSYASGSFVGRFVAACRKDGESFAYRFVGVEVPKEGAILPVEGSVTIDRKLQVVQDMPIARIDWQPFEFNKRRNEHFAK